MMGTREQEVDEELKIGRTWTMHCWVIGMVPVVTIGRSYKYNAHPDPVSNFSADHSLAASCWLKTSRPASNPLG